MMPLVYSFLSVGVRLVFDICSRYLIESSGKSWSLTYSFIVLQHIQVMYVSYLL